MHLQPSHPNIGQVHWERAGDDASGPLCPEALCFYHIFVPYSACYFGYGVLR